MLLDGSCASRHTRVPMKTDNLQGRPAKQPAGRESKSGVVTSRR